MNKSEIKTLNNEELISEFYWNAVRCTKEVNSRRGLTKQTSKEETWIHEELIKRFNLNADLLKEKIYK